MKIYPHLWFESQAEEAMEFYTSVFKDTKILGSTDLPDPELSEIAFPLPSCDRSARIGLAC